MPRHLFRLSLILAAVLALGKYGTASAIQINNEASFVTQTGATLHTLPIVTLLDNVTFFYTADGLSLANAGLLHIATQDPNIHPPVPWTWVGLSGPENLNVGVQGLLGLSNHVFGMSVYQPTDPSSNGCNTAPNPCVHDTFQVTFALNGVPLTYSFLIDPTDNQSQFFGFWLDQPFNQIYIRDLNNSVDNEFFGTFYTGTAPYTGDSSTVPEPSSAVLLVTALIGVAGVGRRRLSEPPA